MVLFYTALSHASVEVTQINNVFAALTIPPIHHKMLHIGQAEIGPAM